MSLILNKYQVYFLQAQYFQEEKTKSCVADKAKAIVTYKECMDRYLISLNFQSLKMCFIFKF